MNRWILALLMSVITSLSLARPLPANEVFQLSTQQKDLNTVSLQWTIKPHYFLYAERIKITTTDKAIQLGSFQFPPALKKTDKLGHSQLIYREQLTLSVPILADQAGEALITVYYQGCADDGFCYPPQTRQIKLSVRGDLGVHQAELYTPVESLSAPKQSSQSASIESLFSNQNAFMVLLSFFGFGLLLAFTPCVLPMIPVLSGIIAGHGEAISTRKAFALSLSYVLSMALTYAVIGAVVALLGSNLQLLMQSPLIIILFSGVFILLACSMFGLFDFKLPVSWQSKLANANRRQKGGHYFGAAVMGSLSILILSPCVTPPLIGALGYIAQSGNVFLGSISLFFLGIGMGTPLILIGTSAGRFLPRAGRWMNAVKAFFGIMLLGVAIFLLNRILPAFYIMLLWASLLVFTGMYMGAFKIGESHLSRLRQGSAIILVVYGLLILVGASMGNTNPLQPLQGSQVMQQSHQIVVKNRQQLAQALEESLGQPVMLDFYADWCNSCKMMEATTFKDSSVHSALKPFVQIKVDMSENSSDMQALLQQYDVVAPPTFIFLNAQGREFTQFRIVGEMNAKTFIKHLQQVL